MSADNFIELEFSKTRIVYYDNQPNGITADGINNLAVITSNVGDGYGDIKIVNLPGTIHNWHQIPINNYGWYCTIAEMQSLFYNFDFIKPISTEAVISHGVPISKYAGTTSTVNLSFNNTIYSLIADIVDDNLDFIQPKQQLHNEHFRTFDGAKYTDNKQLTLPKPDILYKIPWTDNNYTGTSGTDKTGSLDPPTSLDLIEGSPANLSAADNNVLHTLVTELKNHYDMPVTLNEMKNLYLPEFLQDNNHVKALYPGENQDKFFYDGSDNTFASIYTGGLNFNEYFANLDTRDPTLTNAQFNEQYFLNMPVFPQLRGSITSNAKNNFTAQGVENAIDAWKVDADFNTQHRMNCWKQALVSGFSHEDMFASNIPLKFIKCLPILDPDGNLVSHSVCATLTHTFKLKCKPRVPQIPRPIHWGNVYKLQKPVVNFVNGQGHEIKPYTFYYKNKNTKMLYNSFAKKPQRRLITGINPEIGSSKAVKNVVRHYNEDLLYEHTIPQYFQPGLLTQPFSAATRGLEDHLVQTYERPVTRSMTRK